MLYVSLSNVAMMFGGFGLPFIIHASALLAVRSKLSIANYTANPASFSAAFNTVVSITVICLVAGILSASLGFHQMVKPTTSVGMKTLFWAGWLLLLAGQLVGFVVWHAVIYTAIKGVY